MGSPEWRVSPSSEKWPIAKSHIKIARRHFGAPTLIFSTTSWGRESLIFWFERTSRELETAGKLDTGATGGISAGLFTASEASNCSSRLFRSPASNTAKHRLFNFVPQFNKKYLSTKFTIIFNTINSQFQILVNIVWKWSTYLSFRTINSAIIK